MRKYMKWVSLLLECVVCSLIITNNEIHLLVHMYRLDLSLERNGNHFLIIPSLLHSLSCLHTLS